MIPVYVIGSSNTDMVIEAETLPAPGETVLGGKFFMNAGGKGANQAVAAARLLGNVTFVANVGNDPFGLQAIEQFIQEGINTSFITTDALLPSGVALIIVDKNAENCITVAPGANMQLDILKAKTALDSITKNAILLLQQEIPMETVEFIIEYVNPDIHKIILNPAPANFLNPPVFSKIFLITPNETEAELLTGIKVSNIETAEKAADALHEKGVPNVIITLGAKGAYLSTKECKKLINVAAVIPKDTTAAGDCFNGALAVAIAEGMSMEEAVSFACNAAAISVTRMGAQASMPCREEVDAAALLA